MTMLMEDLIRLLIEQGVINSDVQLIPIDLSLFSEESTSCRVRQIVPYLLEELVGVKNALPPKFFTEKYSTVKYPYSVVKKKGYSAFGLEMERLVLQRLSKLYATKYE